MAKVTIIGSGQVGATATYYIAERGLADVVMTDVVSGMPQAKALDALHSAPLRHYDVDIKGTNDLKEMAGSDVVVVTAGLPRKPGMSREDLLNTNARIVAKVSREIAGTPRSRGDRGHEPSRHHDLRRLEGDRLRHPPGHGHGRRARLDPLPLLHRRRARRVASDVSALVLGGHGDEMVPVPEYSVVHGIPVTELISPATGGDRDAHPARAAAKSWACSRREAPSTVRRPPSPRWWSVSCVTPTASCRSPPT